VRETNKFPGGNMRKKVEIEIEFETTVDVDDLVEQIEDTIYADVYNLFIEIKNVEPLGNGDNEGDEEVNFD